MSTESTDSAISSMEESIFEKDKQIERYAGETILNHHFNIGVTVSELQHLMKINISFFEACFLK